MSPNKLPRQLHRVVVDAAACSAPRRDAELPSVDSVALDLYARHHARTEPGLLKNRYAEDERFARLLLEPHLGRLVDDAGWELASNGNAQAPPKGAAGDHDSVLIVKDGVTVRAPQSAWSTGTLALPAVRRHFSAGYVAVLGPQWNGTNPDVDHFDRFYLNIDANRAAMALTKLLEVADRSFDSSPWLVKALNARALYPRTDSIVLYTPPDARSIAAVAVKSVAEATHSGDQTYLQVSAFCADHGFGVGSLSGSNGGSAGLDRCLIVAAAAHRWHGTGLGIEVLEQFVYEGFLQCGFDVDPADTFEIARSNCS